MNVNQRTESSSCIRADIKTRDFVLGKNKLVHHLINSTLARFIYSAIFISILPVPESIHTADPQCEPPPKEKK